ncbi:hypothetical protein GCM10011505_06250 [Tistrella bauzanensis]|uniref:Oxidoreductase N-terminal domain-containing protein n=1 Tax=Tistrella bauzanensis TaxID=657419 RepID=A0ABQ1IA57_9PROT|nr:hypothetical protein GCM10011505_06250 [Tistrella bauzanensis]
MTDVTDGPPDAAPDRIPPWSLPTANRRVILTRRLAGIPRASDFHLDTVPVPTPGAGSFLVRNIYLSVDPAQRG